MSNESLNQSRQSPEPEHKGPIWKHPYLLYILLTVVLFGGLLGAAWLAQTQDWIPHR